MTIGDPESSVDRLGAPGGRTWPSLPVPSLGAKWQGHRGPEAIPGVGAGLPSSVLQAGCKARWEPVYTRAANCTLEAVRDPVNCPEVGGS